MTSIDDADLDTYCGRVGNLYGRNGLCPPFELRRVAADWKVSGIPLSHIVAVIDRHLSDHRSRYYSGSGDALFSWVDEIIRKTWREQHFSPPWAQATRPTMQRFSDRNRIDQQPSADHQVDSLRCPASREALLANRSDAPVCSRADQPPPQSAKSIGKRRTGLKRIDEAMAFLRRELADGEVAATLLEEKAKASGISPRTLDRARARLKVISRRTGFAKDGKCWLSLRTAPKRRRRRTPKKEKERDTHVVRCRQLVADRYELTQASHTGVAKTRLGQHP
jgi:hypothetical protein